MKPKKQYIHGFSHNPLPGIFTVILILLFAGFLLEGLSSSEIQHCQKTVPLKQQIICHN